MTVDIIRWQKFSAREQLLHIASELMRAQTWQNKDLNKFKSALERALELIDLAIGDKKWQNTRAMLWFLRDEIAKFYIGQRNDNIAKVYDLI